MPWICLPLMVEEVHKRVTYFYLNRKHSMRLLEYSFLIIFSLGILMLPSGYILLKDVHIGIPHSGGEWQTLCSYAFFCLVPMSDIFIVSWFLYAVSGGSASLVQGSYEYYHYMQDSFNDSVMENPLLWCCYGILLSKVNLTYSISSISSMVIVGFTGFCFHIWF